ncbi:hypothetical protein ACHAXA_010395 [Cyclostephanos tholiformis]|uniref:Uncharacterized protein n=1 Tax=Cyclostephanos tholiformis TaxID=382380 RepID=A0ABD3SF30_9STRA
MTATCSESLPRRRRRVRFNAQVTGYCVLSHDYPSDYFYTRSDIKRFRREALEERREYKREEGGTDSSAPSPVERAFDIATSSAISAFVLIIGLVAATMACLPILLLLKVSSMLFFPFASCHDDVDSSILPYSPPTDVEASSLAERILFNFIGSRPLSDSSGGNYEKPCIATMLS